MLRNSMHALQCTAVSSDVGLVSRCCHKTVCRSGRSCSGHGARCFSLILTSPKGGCLLSQRSRSAVSRRQLSLAVAAAAAKAVPVRLVVPHLQLQFGEQLKCVGENAGLGNWYLNAAPFLSWTESHTWIHHSQLPPGLQRCKLVIVRDGGSVYWEEGSDRTFEVPESVDGVLEVSCGFGNTSDTNVQIVDAAILEERAGLLETEVEAGIDEPKPATDVSPEEAEDEPLAMEGSSTEGEIDTLAEAQAVLAPAGNKKPEQETSMADEGSMEGVSAAASDAGEDEDPAPAESALAEEEPPAQEAATEEAPAGGGSAPPPTESATHSNGSSNGFKTYGGATAQVIGDDSILVTFSDSEDDEDVATLAERLLSQKSTNLQDA